MDILVIGGGPGGYVAAIFAAKKGANVKLIERDKLGGTCLNRGCIPTKAILHSAKAFYEVKKLSEIGVIVSAPQLDFTQVIKRKNAVVDKLRNGIEYLFKKNNIQIIKGEACFIDKKTVSVDGNEYTADKIIIATGSRPAELPFVKADGNAIWNSDHALAATKLPESIIIVGGGVIGCEFAQAFVRMGVKVTIVEILPRILINMDIEISTLMAKVFEFEGVKIICGSTLKSAEQKGSMLEF
jgi:dihydrolipoamide dehydrogenase